MPPNIFQKTELIRSRVRSGLAAARARGKKLARLRAQGRSIREIAEELRYSRSLVHKTVANRESVRVANAAD